MSFDLPNLARAIKGLAFAGMTFLGVSMVLVVPALLGAGTGLVLHLAALVVGLQAAQSSVVQIGRSLDSSFLGKTWFMTLPAVLLSVVETFTETDPVIDAVLATMSGAFLGLLLGQSGLIVLGGKGGTAFQSFQALRALGLVAAATGAAVFERAVPGLAPLAATLAVASIALFKPRVGRRRTGYSKPDELTGIAGLSVAFGLLASLFYRNDVNWIRTAVSGDGDFIVWHYALIAYSAVQGIVGFLVVQLIFSHRQKWRSRIGRWSAGSWLRIAFSWIVIMSTFISILPTLPVILSVLGCALLAAIVGVTSGFAHVIEMNWAPYIAGVVGAGLLSLLLLTGVDPRISLVLESSAIGSIIILLIILRRRQCSSFK